MISFDHSILREVFQINKEPRYENKKKIPGEIPSFIELENEISNDKLLNNSKSLDMEDIDFDAI